MQSSKIIIDSSTTMYAHASIFSAAVVSLINQNSKYICMYVYGIGGMPGQGGVLAQAAAAQCQVSSSLPCPIVQQMCMYE